MAGRSLRGPAAPLLLVVGVILGLAGLRSLGLVTLLPAGGPTGDGPGEVLASRPIDLERARAAPALPRSVPTRIQIPAITVDAPITPLGLDENGSVQVPPLDEPALTGWYQSGAAPGQRGSAVILGHVDTRKDGRAVPQGAVPHLAGVRTARLPRSAPGHLRWPVRLPASPVPGQRHGLRQRPWVTR